ncbi:hypothetical protein ACQ86F_36630 [Streptomyces venezuelae ATCC 10712]
MSDFSRRKVLGTLAAGSALSVLPPSLLTAMAAPLPRGDSGPSSTSSC